MFTIRWWMIDQTRVLIVTDQWTRWNPILEPAQRMSGQAVAEALNRVVAAHGKLQLIAVDYGTEFISLAFDEWAYRLGMLLDFFRPGKPDENGSIKPPNGILRGECLNANQFLSIHGAPNKIKAWTTDHDLRRPRSAFGNVSLAKYLKRVGPKGEEAAIFSF